MRKEVESRWIVCFFLRVGYWLPHVFIMCLRGSDWLYIDGYWFDGKWMVVWEDGWKFVRDGNKFEFIDGLLVWEDVIYYSSVR